MFDSLRSTELCDNDDCVLCLRWRWRRLSHIYRRASERADRRFGQGTLWLDALDLRTKLARAKLDAWHNLTSAEYSAEIERIENYAR